MDPVIMILVWIGGAFGFQERWHWKGTVGYLITTMVLQFIISYSPII